MQKTTARTPLNLFALLFLVLTLDAAHGAATASVPAGQPVTFSVTSLGTPPFTYQWRKDGAAIAGATNATLVLTAARTSDSGAYSVQVSNPGGSTLSDTGSLTVNPVIVVPAITTQPSSVTVMAGQSASFTVSASGPAPFSYQWRKDGVEIPGATDATYTVPTAGSESTGFYSVVVSNSAGSVTSNTALLTVNPLIIAPAITSGPVASTITEGESATFSVSATGTAPLVFQWQKDGSPLPGAIGASCTLAAARLSDAGAYSVLVSNAAGSIASTSAILTVKPAIVAPSITTQPGAVAVTEGEAAVFCVAAAGSAPLTYQWTKDGVNLPGANQSTLTLDPSALSSAGTYAVVVSNPAGSITSAHAILTVHPALVAPTIVTPPASLTVRERESATFAVAASGSDPLTYQWTRDGANIPGATSPTYLIPITSLASAGTYAVRVSNAAGSVASAGVSLVVTPLAVAPAITNAPASTSVAVGARASFSVTASGTGPLTYQWRKNGSRIYGANSATYTIWSTPFSSAGTYTVTVTNSAGSVTSPGATLSVLTPPSISTQPVPISTAEGKAASFSVSASGSSPLAYQWRRNGLNIAGANGSSHTIAAASAADAGAYSVVVSNPVGVVTSREVILKVLVPPTIITPPASLTVTAHAPASFSVQASGSGPLSYQWRKLRRSRGTYVDVAGATAASYSVGSADSADAGTYCVVVSNAFGSVTSAPATLRVTGITTFSAGSTGEDAGRLVGLAAESTVRADAAGATGFVVHGTGHKILLVRGAARARGGRGLPATLKVYSGSTAVAVNSGWESSNEAAELLAAVTQLGLPALKQGMADCVSLLAFPPGEYTAVLSSQNAAVATGSIEVHDVERDSTARLAGLTSQGLAGRHTAVEGRFVLEGTGRTPVLVRAIGPGLSRLGVENPLARPALRVLSAEGKTLASNTGWRTGADAAALQAAAASLGLLPLADRSADAAVLVELAPGSYSLRITGAGSTDGTVLLEAHTVQARLGD